MRGFRPADLDHCGFVTDERHDPGTRLNLSVPRFPHPQNRSDRAVVSMPRTHHVGTMPGPQEQSVNAGCHQAWVPPAWPRVFAEWHPGDWAARLAPEAISTKQQ